MHPDGAFAATGGAAAHAAEQGLVEHVCALLDWARGNDVPVIHNQIVSFLGRDFGEGNAPIFGMIGPESLRLGSWGPLHFRVSKPMRMSRCYCVTG